MTSHHQPQLTVPQLVGLAFDRVVSGLQETISAAGYTDVRPPHFLHVFRFLSPDGNRPADLARRAGITPQSMGELISYLEQRGYVRRIPDPDDKRSRIVQYADRGVEAARVADRYFAELEAAWAARLGDGEMTQMRSWMRAMLTDDRRGPRKPAPDA